MKKLAIVILAAGKSTRMKSATSKVLHRLAGLPLVSYPLQEALKLRPQKLVMVVGRGEEASFEQALGRDKRVKYCTQAGARGTGDAVLSVEGLLKNFDGYVLVLPGDVPLIFSSTLGEFIGTVEEGGADCAIISTCMPDPAEYGRVIRDDSGRFLAIREARDATDDELEIDEINTGIVLARSNWLFESLKEIKPHNAQNEYYLTDVIDLAARGGRKVMAHCMLPHEQFLGVNDRAGLAYAAKIMHFCIAEYWMVRGVSVQDPDQTYIDSTVTIGEDANIAPSVFLRGKTRVGKGCIIDTGTVLTDATVGDNVYIKPYSVIEESRIMEGAQVGPFSRVRPGSYLGRGVKVGNFVEVKKSVLKPGVKANHLSYIGDATIGAKTNVGCGTITCNYDGRAKHRTVIGEGVLVGSDTQFVAPVRIGKNAVIGAGSTITKNVPPKALALSRVEQVNISNWKPRGEKRSKVKGKRRKD